MVSTWADALRLGLNGMVAELITGLDSQGVKSNLQIPASSGQWIEVFDLTLSLDTNAYADGDVLADRQELASVGLIAGAGGVIQSVLVLDEDDQAQALDIVFLNSDVTLGTENSAVTISDENARSIVGVVEVGTDDYVDLAGSQIAHKENLGIGFQCASAATSLYVGAISRGTGTYTASGIRLKISIMQGM